ncbi:hypothetical protein BRAS3809_80006 [Bradyrhizobium sp. STM 3809]|nr:hypothetical protein BRAS3809_80006 [Bradyrhizobium sp. STM 3809]
MIFRDRAGTVNRGATDPNDWLARSFLPGDCELISLVWTELLGQLACSSGNCKTRRELLPR